jgi:prepilin-type N-terminal cleavage/methylation domain-containing protein
MIKPFRFRNRGFSLIELTVALLIVVLLAGIALRSTNELSFQVRYDQTQERLNRIKEAIVGDPSRTVNGQPDISGFVADMGRLPDNIRELLQTGICSDTTIIRPSLCTSPNMWTWSSIQTYSTDPITHLGYGWRGPYLTVSNNPDDPYAFTDGWGRGAQGYCSDYPISTNPCSASISSADDHNYGWWYGISNNELTVFSYGKDQQLGGTGDYDVDYPSFVLPAQPLPLVDDTDWGASLPANVNVTVKTNLRLVQWMQRPSSEVICERNGRTWIAANTPPCAMATEYTSTQCQTNEGIWDIAHNSCSTVSLPTLGEVCTAAGGSGSPCAVSSAPITQPACNAAGGTWSGGSCISYLNTITEEYVCGVAGGSWNVSNNTCSAMATPILCLNLYYRDSTGIVPFMSSSPNPITENGLPQTLTFSVGTSGNMLPLGNAAFSIHFGNATTGSVCSGTTYPFADRSVQLITILPRGALAFSW